MSDQQQPAMFDPGPPATRMMSYSQLSTFNSCAKKFELRYIRKVPTKPGGALIGGRAVHEAVEDGEKFGHAADRLWVTNRFHMHFSRMLEEAGGPKAVDWGGRKTKEFPEGESAAWWRSVGAMMCRRFCDVREEDEKLGFSVVPESIEMRVQLQLPWGSMLRGVMDAFMYVSPDGEARIRDWKTGRPWPGSEIQLATYAMMAKKVLDLTVNTGEFIYLRQNDRSKRRIVVKLDRFIPLVEPMLKMFEDAWNASLFPMNPGPMCRSCNVRHECEWGKTLEPEAAWPGVDLKKEAP